MKKITLLFVTMLFAFSLNAQKTTSVFAADQNLSAKERNEMMTNPTPHYQAPAYVKSRAFVIAEGFESGVPATWTQYKLGDATSPGFVASATAHSGAGSMYHNDDNLTTAAQDWIVLPQVAVTDAAYKLKFWERDHYQTFYEYHGVWISTGSGDPASGDFTEVWSVDGTEAWKEVTVDLASYNGQSIYIAFKYTGDYKDEWYIDDVKVGMPEPHDLAASSVAPAFVLSGSTATPTVGIHNFGANDESAYAVHLVINDGTNDVYDNTVNATTAIASGADATIDMPAWTPADGTYTLTATVTVANDTDASNNQITGNCIVVSPNTYAGNATDHLYGFVDLATGAYTATGTMGNSPFPMAEEYNGTNVYRINYAQATTTSTIGTVASDGTYTNLGTLTGVTGTPTALAWDWANSTMYVVILGSGSTPHLCTLDMSTYVLTEVGVGTAGASIIGMDFANDGFLYGPAINDKFYKIDPATGLTTEVGAVGLDVKFGQDVSYDPVAETMYTYATLAAGNNKYGTYNLTTGAFTQITDLGSRKQFATFVITKAPAGAVSENTVKGLEMFPNPVNDVLNINATNNIDQVQVINLLGQELININANATSVQVNLSQLSAGNYLVKVVAGNNVSVQKIAKK